MIAVEPGMRPMQERQSTVFVGFIRRTTVECVEVIVLHEKGD